MKGSRKMPGMGDTSSAERKQAEERLAKEQAMLNAIIDLNPLPIQVFDGEGHHFKANRAFIEMFASVPPPDYCWFDDPISAQAGFHDEHLKVKEGEVVKHDALWYNPRWLNPNFPDKLTCFRSSVFPILMNPEGKTERFVVMFEDITKQKQAEETLRAERDFNAALVEASPAFLATIGGDGRIRSMNQVMLQALGYTLEEVAGKDYLTTIVNEAERPLLAGVFARLTELREPTLNENHVLTRDGRLILVEWHGRPILKPNGEFDYFFGFGLDITERKQAEEAIKAEQQRSYAILEAATVPMIILRLSDNTVMYANEALAKIENTDLETLIGSRAVDYFANPDDQNKVVELLQQQGRISDLEIQLRRGDGSLYWVLLSARIINYQNDICVLSSYVDISDRKLVEIELHRQVSILDNSRDFIAAVDMQGVHIYVNLAGARMLGYDDPSELIGKRVKDMHSPEDTLRVEQEGIPTAMRAGIWRGENRLLRLDGTSLPVDQSIFVIRDAQGQPQAVATIMVDITERKRAEQALRESEEKFRDLADSLAVGVFIHQDGVIKYLGREAARILGYSDPDETIGHSIMNLVHPDERLRIADIARRRVAGESVPGNYETRLLRKDGTGVDVDMYNALVSYEGRTATQGAFLDITARKRAEGRLQAIFESAPEAIVVVNCATGLFTESNENAVKLYGLSHEELVKVGLADMSPPIQPDGRLSTEKALEKINAARQGEVPVFEWIHRNARGEDIPCEVRLVRLPGHLPLVRASVTDITERKRTEAVVRESKELYQALIDTTATGYVVIDAQGKVLDANAEYVRLAGHHDLAEIRGRSPVEWTAEYEQKRNAEAIQQCLKDGNIRNFEIDYIDQNGKTTPIEINATVIEGRILTLCRDITARRLVEDVLQKANAKVQAVLDAATQEAIIATDPDGVITVFNTGAERMLGYSAEEMVGKQTPASLHLEAEVVARGQELSAEFGRPIAGFDVFVEHARQGRYEERNWTYVRKDGAHLTVRLTVTALRDSAGNIIGFLGMARDITERKRAEERLRLFRALADNAGDAIVIADLEGKVAYANHAEYELLGYDYEKRELDGVSMSVLAPEQERARQAEVVGQIMATGGSWSAESIVACKDGSIRDVAITAFPIFDEHNRPASIGTFLRDITERKQTEAMAQESRARFQGLVETLNDWIWEVDQKGAYTYVSPRIKDLLGYEPEEVLGKTPFDLMPPEEAQRVAGVFGPLLSTQQPLDALENTNRHKDGHLVVFETSGVPFFDATGEFKGYRGTDRDITERKQAEEELQKLASVVQHSSEMINLATLDGKMIFLNEAGSRMLGIAPAEAGQHTILEAIPEQWQRMVQSEFLPVIMEKGRWEGDLQYRNIQTNALTDVHAMAFMIKDAKTGAPLYLANVSLDITERKQADQALQSSRQDLRTIFDSVYDAIFIHDLNGSILDVNEQMLKIYRVEREQALNYSIIEDYSAPQDRLADLPQTWQEVIDGKIAIFTWKSRRPNDGSLFDTEVVLRKINMEGREAILANVRDITERKRLEREIQEAFERRGYQVQVSTEISQEIAAASELSDLFGRVVTLTKERLGYYHTQIFRYDPARDIVVLAAGYGEAGQRMLAAEHQRGIGRDMVGTAAQTGQSILAADVTRDPDWRPNPYLPGAKGELAVPIKLRDQVLGILDVQSDQVNALTDDDRLLLEGLCGQIAIAIENVRLYEQSSAALRKVDALNRRLTGEGWETYLQRQSSQQVIWVGDDETLAPDALNAADEQLSSGQIVIEPMVGDEQQATVSVPVMLRGQAIGALRIAMPQAAYTDELHNTLDSIAGHLAQAAENARLIEQTQHTAQREKQIAQAADKIHRASDLDSVFRAAVEEVSRIVGVEKVGIQLGAGAPDGDGQRPKTFGSSGSSEAMA